MNSVKQTFITLAFLSGLFVSNVQAHPIVSDSGSLLCRMQMDSRFPFLTMDQVLVTENSQQTQFSRVEVEGYFMSQLIRWVDTLTQALDPLFQSPTAKPLCVGFFDDHRGANAVAIGDAQIVFGAVLTAKAMREYGEASQLALTYVLAHEFAHILQARQNLSFDYGAPGMRLDLLSTKIKELHADCVAGYILETHRQIPYQFNERVESFVKALGDAHAVGDHGLPEARAKAFREGARLANLERVIGFAPTQIRSQKATAACGISYRPQKF